MVFEEVLTSMNLVRTKNREPVGRGTAIWIQIFQETQVQISAYFLWKNISQDTNSQDTNSSEISFFTSYTA